MSFPSDTPEWLPKILNDLEEENRELLLTGKLVDVGEVRGRFYAANYIRSWINVVADEEEARIRRAKEEMTERADKPATN